MGSRAREIGTIVKPPAKKPESETANTYLKVVGIGIGISCLAIRLCVRMAQGGCTKNLDVILNVTSIYCNRKIANRRSDEPASAQGLNCKMYVLGCPKVSLDNVLVPDLITCPSRKQVVDHL
jgi:hypothetical protein